MPYPETAEAFVVTDIKNGNWSNFSKQEVKLKKFEETDIDIAVDACGVCGSDVHTISGGWSEDVPLPLCVGHEIIGRAVRVGSQVKSIQVGDRVGVGAQIGADLTCDQCKAHQENYCPNQIATYAAPYPDGTLAQGGYSSHVRAHEYFTFKIPDNLDTALAAPMLCAGLTVFSPLKMLGAGPGKKIGVVGIGGLGHFAILFGKALGAEVWALSHTPDKEADAKELGAAGFINTKEKNWADQHKFKFDFIINAADATNKFTLPDYFSTLKVHGVFHNVGLPDGSLNEFAISSFMSNGNSMGGSHIGNREDMEEMFKLASEQKIKSWVETIEISEAGCKEAVERVYKNDRVRYRFTLTGFDKAFGKRS